MTHLHQQTGERTMLAPAPLVAPTRGLSEVGHSGDAHVTREQRTRGIGVRLTRAAVRTFNVTDSRPEIVSFCFGSAVQEIRKDGGAFYLQAYDPSVHVQAIGAEVSRTDRRCVLAGFAPGTPLPDYTLALIGQAAVSDHDGRVNMVRSVPLEGSQGRPAGGRTAAPELVRTTVDTDTNQLTYFFDVATLAGPGAAVPADQGSRQQPPAGLDQLADTAFDARISAHAVGYYRRDGRPVVGKIEAVKNNSLVVGFGMEAEVRDAVRPFVMPGATHDVLGHANLLGALNKSTALADLLGVTPVENSPEQYDFTFDQPVTQPRARLFFVYTDAGGRSPATGAHLLDNTTTVRVTFAGLREVADQLIRAAVASAAVHSGDAIGGPNSVGSVAIRGRVAPSGPTAGPDLVKTHLDRHNGQVTFVFDEPADGTGICVAKTPGEPSSDQRSAARARPDEDQSKCRRRFFLVSYDGRVVRPRQILTVDGSTLRLQFRATELRTARVLGMFAGALRGHDGQPNPATSVPVRGRRH